MTADDLHAVETSWEHLRTVREALVTELARRLDAGDRTMMTAEERATWLVDAVEELVGLLSAPSRLAARARTLGETWPDRLTAPSFQVEGRAWMRAAARCVPTWSYGTDAAWRQAWLLLSDVLAAETLSPFADPARIDASGIRFVTPTN